MKVLITGAGGQVGHDLRLCLTGEVPAGGAATALFGAEAVTSGEFDVVPVDRAALDVSDAAGVDRAMAELRPDVVVHLAAYTAVDRAETDAAQALLINEVGTQNVSRAASEVGAHLIYVSTDYVFAGDLGRSLDETDVTGPLSTYGSTKLAGEERCAPGSSIVRTSWVAGASKPNVLHLAARAAASGQELAFVEDQVGSLTAAADLAAALVFFIRNRPAGIVHVAGSGEASWYEVIAHAVAAAGGSRDQVRPISTAALDPQPLATRPAYSPLISARHGELGSQPLPEWQDGADRLIAALATRGTT